MTNKHMIFAMALGLGLLPFLPAEVAGWIGAVLFSLSAAPQAYLAYKRGNTDGLSASLLTMWFLGETYSLRAVLGESVYIYYVIANYVLNLVCLLFILRYRFYPRESNVTVLSDKDFVWYD